MNYMINIIRTKSPLLLLFFLVILSPRARADADGKRPQDDNTHEPSLAERAIGITGLNSRWDAIRTWAKLAWMNIRPPDSRFGTGSDGGGANMVKEAAARSFETSRETVEQAAEAAAKVAGEATEKLKRSLSSDERGEHSEL